MSYFSEMEYTKWDWENFVMFGSKASDSPKKVQSADWMVMDDGEISFNLSGGAGNSGGSGSGSGSEVGHRSSAKCSISASTDSLPKDGVKIPNFKFEAFEGSAGDFSKNIESTRNEVSRTSLLETSVGSAEPPIGLKLGKRMYFENSSAGGSVKSASFTVVPTSSTSITKKSKSSAPNGPIPRCQVEGCNMDLSAAKDYHRKHRVCNSHSKCPKVIVGGLERRFCQQCSRFHGVSEFDEKKRSCRRRLSDHNARRRKPQQETIQFNSGRLTSPFYDGRPQMDFFLNNGPLIHSRTATNSACGSTCSSKFTLTKVFPSKPEKAGGLDGQVHIPGIQPPHTICMHDNVSNGSTSEVLNPGASTTPPLPPFVHSSLGQSLVPYLFGGLAAILGLIAFALMSLACSYRKFSSYGGDGDRDLKASEGNAYRAASIKPSSVLEEKYLMIMVGKEKPTFLATPMSSISSSFRSKSTNNTSSATTLTLEEDY